MAYLLINIFVFVFGVCIGSFLNCVIYRMENKKSLKGRSFCPKCRHTLVWYDLFPILSYIFLFGKCRYCRQKISAHYPAVEIITGVIFLIIFNFLKLSCPVSFWNILILAVLLYISASLIAIFIYDLKHYLIPDKILIPAIVIVFAYRFIEFLKAEEVLNFSVSQDLHFGNYIFSGLLASGFFLIIFLITKGAGMGFGDVKLAFFMGIFLGFPAVVVAMFLAFFFGAIMGVILIFLKKKGLKSQMPFGPFLIIGTFFALLWGQELARWYLGFAI